MCWHKRIIFSVCCHSRWGPETAKCDAEKAYEEGLRGEGCYQRWSQPRDVVRVEVKCRKCVLAKRRTDEQFARVKAVLTSLRKAVDAALVVSDEAGAVLDDDGDHGAVSHFDMGRDRQLSTSLCSTGSSSSGLDSNFERGKNIPLGNEWAQRPRWRSRHYVPVKTDCEMF
ncbi:hypothetical protein M0657_001932 [Pyricularia oryzae]|uniref:Uncharacterized protein n=2 Tax=Pyricularia oryzae TaxID=318829 RepID=A0AA97PQ98_PYRO3|nr:hypothetical protein OOU_Y34scaffold00194g56 [Pyricularia oryzae Y34]KAI7926390.1 hypothetical protein M9X92_002736 [Pyricularia oryzae]KAI7929785.1 hypothetical protein M0657_001932 [Pyricularia oryzae]